MTAKKRLRTAMLLIGVNLFILFSIEAAARITTTLRRDYLEWQRLDPRSTGWTRDDSIFGWVRRPDFAGDVEGVYRRFDAQGYVWLDSAQVTPPPKAKKRVLLFGDSNTMGYKLSAGETFTEVLDTILPQVDAVNLGVFGYSSFQGLAAVRQYVPALDPDAIVVSFNCNDIRFVESAAEVDSRERFADAYRASYSWLNPVGRLLQISHTAAAVRKLLTATGALPDLSYTRLDSLLPRVAIGSYRANLDSMARVAQARGIPIVFMVLGENPVMMEPIDRGLQLAAEGNTDLAIEYLISAEGSPMHGHRARLELGRLYDSIGESALAATTLRSNRLGPRIDGYFPLFSDTAYNRVMREVAVEWDAPVVEAAAMMNSDPARYIDNCHLDAEGHRRIGAALATVIDSLFSASGG